MSQKLIVPDIGEFENVEVIEILVKPGDEINRVAISFDMCAISHEDQ